MVAIDLDQSYEDFLGRLARSEGLKPSDVAQRVVEDYLDFQALRPDDAAMWADSSVALSSEIMNDEHWDDA